MLNYIYSNFKFNLPTQQYKKHMLKNNDINNLTVEKDKDSFSYIKPENYRANFIAFSANPKTRIIDSHAHIESAKFPKHFFYEKNNGIEENDLSPEIVNKAISIDNLSAGSVVESVLVSNISGIDTKEHIPGGIPLQNEKESNEELLKICDKYTKFKPLAVCQPSKGKPYNIEQLILNNKFYGLKFHPYYLGLNADDKLYDPYLKIADKYHLPCVFHSAPGTSDPEKIYELAKRHKNVPVVLYHMNLGGDLQKAINVVKEAQEKKDANLYLEISWVDMDMDPRKKSLITKAIDTVGEDKILFGTDTSLGTFGKTINDKFEGTKNYDKRVKQIQDNIHANYPENKANEIIDKIFYENSQKLFNVSEHEQMLQKAA